MKRITTKYVLALGIALGVSLCVQAQSLYFNFDTGSPGYVNFNLIAPGGAPDTLNGALQTSDAAQTWYNNASLIDFGTVASQNANASATVDIANMISSSGGCILTFTMVAADAGSFNSGAGGWNFGLVPQSAADSYHIMSMTSGGWLFPLGSASSDGGSMTYTPGAGDGIYTFTFTSAQMDWQVLGGDYYKLDFLTAGSVPFQPYIENMSITPVPEPTSLALAGLGAAALLIFRRRK